MSGLIVDGKSITKNTIAEMTDGELLDVIYSISNNWNNPIMSKLDAIQWVLDKAIDE